MGKCSDDTRLCGLVQSSLTTGAACFLFLLTLACYPSRYFVQYSLCILQVWRLFPFPGPGECLEGGPGDPSSARLSFRGGLLATEQGSPDGLLLGEWTEGQSGRRRQRTRA